ncbi:hypothetical protein EVAR_90769_1 [Eumeta japonica]|uniref:Uncharacterized protein n=1 Tax=Eumeta variegata TaxID=151549 RepID=A0A4C1YE19_EUMVA|nr:hypothetical protein EVAR_90769_1 [Eumeta japonica]
MAATEPKPLILRCQKPMQAVKHKSFEQPDDVNQKRIGLLTFCVPGILPHLRNVDDTPSHPTLKQVSNLKFVTAKPIYHDHGSSWQLCNGGH